MPPGPCRPSPAFRMPACDVNILSEPVFVILLRNWFPAWRNRFPGSINVYKYGLCLLPVMQDSLRKVLASGPETQVASRKLAEKHWPMGKRERKFETWHFSYFFLFCWSFLHCPIWSETPITVHFVSTYVIFLSLTKVIILWDGIWQD
jgi:hypothetical protein